MSINADSIFNLASVDLVLAELLANLRRASRRPLEALQPKVGEQSSSYHVPIGSIKRFCHCGPKRGDVHLALNFHPASL